MATLMSKITTKFQTTVPSGVRKALDLAPGDQVSYVIRGNRALIIKARAEEPRDPALDGFLALLTRDITSHPERLKNLSPSLIARLRNATAKIDVDLDSRITGPVAL
jgi:antitoxin PrlF